MDIRFIELKRGFERAMLPEMLANEDTACPRHCQDSRRRPEIAAAQAAVRLAWEADDQAEASNLSDAGTATFANAFLKELIRLQESSVGILRRLVRGANTLNVDRLPGLTEVVQNADDVGVNAIRLCLCSVAGGRQQLLVVHTGAHIRSGNGVSTALSFISTKSDDAEANSR